MNRHAVHTCRPANARRRVAGFTLIEVLAALVLVGIVLPVAMRGVSLSLQASAKARHTSEGTELARHKLAELTLATDPGAYTATGDFGTDWPDYRWESRAIEREYGVTEVTVEVFWKARGADESLTLSTLAYPGAYLAGTTTGSTDSSSSGTSGSGGQTQ